MHDSGNPGSPDELSLNAGDFLSAYRAERPTPGAESAWSNLAAVEARITADAGAASGSGNGTGEASASAGSGGSGHPDLGNGPLGGLGADPVTTVVGWLKPFGLTVAIGIGGLGVASQVVQPDAPDGREPASQLAVGDAPAPARHDEKPPRDQLAGPVDDEGARGFDPSASSATSGPAASPGIVDLDDHARSSSPSPEDGGPSPARAPEAGEHGTPRAHSRSHKSRTAAVNPASGGPRDATSQLAAEVRLMERAKKAMATKRWDEALRLLDQHAREFPSGALAEDRQAFVVQAVCSQGKLAEGRKKLEAFSAKYPRAPSLARLRAACGLDR